MSETDERLRGIEDRLAHIEQIIENLHRTVTPFIENPGTILKKLMSGK